MRDIECESLEEAVAIVKDDLGAEPNSSDSLAQAGGPATGTVTGKLGAASLRQKLTDFFPASHAELQRTKRHFANAWR